ELKQLAGARDLSFSKDADNFAVADGVAGRPQRADHVSRAQLGRNWYGLHHACKWLDDGLVINSLEHQKADRPVRGSQKQQHVDERHVVGNEERAAFFRDVVAPNHLDSVKSVRQKEEQQAQKPVRQEIEKINGAAEGDDRSGKE